jgi:EmrB/QacA subfamily drug resistance transporter
MAADRAHDRRWEALVVLSLANFMVILDTSIIGVSLPSIQRALDFSVQDLSWVYNGYVIAFGGLLLLGGRAADHWGRRRTFAVGFGIFSVASLLAGLADAPGVLIAARALQGLGAAITVPAALSIVTSIFMGTSEFNRAMAVWGAAAPVGAAAGVLLGGVLSEWLSWRWIFLVNVPVGAAVLVLVPVLLAHDRGHQRRRFDLPGAVMSTGALLISVYAIVEAPERGWGSTETIVLLAVAAGLLGGFLAWEARSREPLVPLGFFRSRNVSGANGLMLLTGATWIPMFFIVSLYMQDVLGLSAIEGGLAFLPMTVVIMVVVLGFVSTLVERYGYRPNTVAGLVFTLVAMLWFAQISADGSYLSDVLGPSVLVGFGLGFTYVPTTIAGVSEAPPEEAGLASGLISTSYQFGSALGLAALTAVYTARAADAADAGAMPADALTAGFQDALYAGAGIAAVGALVAFTVLRPAEPGIVRSRLSSATEKRDAARQPEP